MSTVSESVANRVTLGYLVSHYGFDIAPSFVSGVTITSLANSLDSVKPGALYIPMRDVDEEHLQRAQERGAYAALVPHTVRSIIPNPSFPLLFAEPSAEQLGKLASDIAGEPSNSIAVFAIGGSNSEETQLNVMRLADVLHMLGNPVGIVSVQDSKSLERELNVSYPLNMFDVQYVMSICLEDGAAAVVLALDEQTLENNALQSVSVDVIGSPDELSNTAATALLRRLKSRYGFSIDKQAVLTMQSEESKSLAAQAPIVHDRASQEHLSLSIAMALAAGVRRNNIKSALRVSRDLR